MANHEWLKAIWQDSRDLNSLVNTAKVRMGFGISKCGALVMKNNRKYHKSDRISLKNRIWETDTDGGYKYLEV